MPTTSNAVPASFDGLARRYDVDFTSSSVAQALRQKTWRRLDALFQPSMRVLEIGCGTGEDALHMTQRGVKVVATDASPEMLAVAQQKVPTAEFHPLDLNAPQTWQLAGQFDGVYSNFGALNCTPNWHELSPFLADITTHHAVLAFGVMGRFCLWETLWHGLHGDWKTATRRWSGENLATLPDGSQFPVYYPSIKTLISAFSPAFHSVNMMGVGTFLPPSDVYPVLEKYPFLFHALNTIEQRFAPARLADHFWLELRK